METKQNPKAKEKSTPAAKKQRTDRSTSINQYAYDVLVAASKRGFKKMDFASAAIIAHGKENLGDAMPASPEDMLESRLGYLERIASKIAWEAACEDNPGRARNLRQLVAQTGHSPISRDFGALNKLREARGKGAADDIAWITAAFAEKFGFTQPEAERK